MHSYNDLRRYAKDHGIKASGTKDQLIASLAQFQVCTPPVASCFNVRQSVSRSCVVITCVMSLTAPFAHQDPPSNNGKTPGKSRKPLGVSSAPNRSGLLSPGGQKLNNQRLADAGPEGNPKDIIDQMIKPTRSASKSRKAQSAKRTTKSATKVIKTVNVEVPISCACTCLRF